MTSHPSDLLAAARAARKLGQPELARDLYRECWARGMPVAAEYAGLFYEAGEFSEAERVLDCAIASSPDPDLHFLRGLTRLAGGNPGQAIEDFGASISQAGPSVPTLFNRGLAFYRLDRVEEALADFTEVTTHAAGMADAWANIGILQQRRGHPEEAVIALQRAVDLDPQPHFERQLANALRASGHFDMALSIHARINASLPDNPDALTDHALCLLSAGQAEHARRRCLRALEIAPNNQTAVAGLYLACNELGLVREAERLMDFSRLLAVHELGIDASLDMGALVQAALGHPGLRWEPAGRSTVRGQQSTMLDLSAGSPFAALTQAIGRLIDRRVDELERDPHLRAHPWLRGRPAQWRLQAWVTILRQGGHQSPHIHPAGWLSGVLYVDAGVPARAGEGDLIFGSAPLEVRVSAAPVGWKHTPRTGQLLMFPSYFLHHTAPYNGPSPRISLAFDVIPVELA